MRNTSYILFCDNASVTLSCIKQVMFCDGVIVTQRTCPLLSAVESKGQRRSNSIELSPDRHRGRLPHPLQIMEAGVQSLKKGKTAGVDNIPAELVQAGGEDVITALTTICNKIWQTGEWPTPLIQSLVITLPKKGNLQQCQDYRTISLISHPSKVMHQNRTLKSS